MSATMSATEPAQTFDRPWSDGVSLETAHEWEMQNRASSDQSTICLQYMLGPTDYEKLVAHFIISRTKSWAKLRREYWERHPASAQRLEDDYVDNGFQKVIITGRRERIGQEFYGFLDLPREIRDMIYEHLLVRSELYVPNKTGRIEHYEDEAGQRYRRYMNANRDLLQSNSRRGRSSLGLIMGVSRAVHAETTTLFFGRNRIILPAGPFRLPNYFNSRFDTFVAPPAYGFQGTEAKVARDYRPLVRNVSYTFDMRDCVTADHENLIYNYDTRNEIDDGTLGPQQALLRLHDQKTFSLERDWSERIDSIKQMKLDVLQLSFEECYCAVGCCRKVGWVMDRFVHYGPLPGIDENDHVWSSFDWEIRPPLVIEVIGWVSEKEKLVIQDKLSQIPAEDGVEIRLIAPRPD